jgi:hypothetical protein
MNYDRHMSDYSTDLPFAEAAPYYEFRVPDLTEALLRTDQSGVFKERLETELVIARTPRF